LNCKDRDLSLKQAKILHENALLLHTNFKIVFLGGGAIFSSPNPTPTLPPPITNFWIRYCFYATRAKNSKITYFRGYPSLTPTCAGLLELRKSRLGLLKFAFNAENFIRRLFASISSHFGVIHS